VPTNAALTRLYSPRLFNATTRQRFFRDRKKGYVAHIGSTPSRPQLALIHRIVRLEWDLLRLDARMDDGELSPHALHTRLAAENRLRLDLKALGLEPTATAPPSLADITAEIAASKRQGARAG
jgi:hypothetical protein